MPAAFAAQQLPYRNPIFSGLGFAGSPGLACLSDTTFLRTREPDVRLSPTGDQIPDDDSPPLLDPLSICKVTWSHPCHRWSMPGQAPCTCQDRVVNKFILSKITVLELPVYRLRRLGSAPVGGHHRGGFAWGQWRTQSRDRRNPAALLGTFQWFYNLCYGHCRQSFLSVFTNCRLL